MTPLMPLALNLIPAGPSPVGAAAQAQGGPLIPPPRPAPLLTRTPVLSGPVIRSGPPAQVVHPDHYHVEQRLASGGTAADLSALHKRYLDDNEHVSSKCALACLRGLKWVVNGQRWDLAHLTEEGHL